MHILLRIDRLKRFAARGKDAFLSSVTVIILALLFTTVEMHAADRPVLAASGATVTTPSPIATDHPASVTTNTGGSAPWGFLLAIVAAIAIFVVGGLFIVLRSRREYLDEQARKAALRRDGDA